MATPSIGLFCDNYVGAKVLQFLLINHRDHLKCVALKDINSYILPLLETEDSRNISLFYDKDLYNVETIDQLNKLQLDYIILAWWPTKIKKPILTIPKKGIINLHPSLLPYGRGKNPNFWAIIENSPFGVSLHFIDSEIDTGDILFQRKIPVDWEATGETLYKEAIQSIIELFIESYPKIVKEEYQRIKQANLGTFHFFRELDEKSRICLDQKYTARELLNLIRARTFNGCPACYFYEEDQKYEVRVEINRIEG